MIIPDYSDAIETVAAWIGAAAQLVPDKTLFTEPDFPLGPDRVALVFETGGQWNEEQGILAFSILMVTRAGTLKEARKFAAQCANSGLAKFKTETRPAGLIRLSLAQAPLLRGRDERKRPVHETRFEMRMKAPGLHVS